MRNSPRITRRVFDRGGLFYGWLTNNPLWQDSLREMARHFPPSVAALNVLDVGCGPGNSARQLLEYRPDLRITGLDFSAGMLQLARRALTSRPGRALARTNGDDLAHFAQADLAQLPIPDNSVDAITGHSVFYMLADQSAFLTEALRVLRPGGRLILLDPVLRSFPIGMIRQFRQPRAALSVLVWHAVSLLYRRYTLEQMANCLTRAGFARVLAERAVEGYAVLSRGEKPYPALSPVERIARTAASDGAGTDLQVIESTALSTMGRGRFVFLLVRQTPDKPSWAIQPGEIIRWDAAMVSETVNYNRPCLLAFTSLPKAVEFMQPAVTNGLLKGISKVAKFDKAIASQWAVDVLLNPPFEALRSSGCYSFAGASLAVDPTRAVIGEE